MDGHPSYSVELLAEESARQECYESVTTVAPGFNAGGSGDLTPSPLHRLRALSTQGEGDPVLVDSGGGGLAE